MEPKDKVPSLSADSDYKYKKLLHQYNDTNFGANPAYLGTEHDQHIYQNYFDYVMSYVKSHSGHPYPKDPRTLLLKNQATINRCFFPSSLEEIQENLKSEASQGSTFAQMCLDKMS